MRKIRVCDIIRFQGDTIIALSSVIISYLVLVLTYNVNNIVYIIDSFSSGGIFEIKLPTKNSYIVDKILYFTTNINTIGNTITCDINGKCVINVVTIYSYVLPTICVIMIIIVLMNIIIYTKYDIIGKTVIINLEDVIKKLNVIYQYVVEDEYQGENMAGNEIIGEDIVEDGNMAENEIIGGDIIEGGNMAEYNEIIGGLIGVDFEDFDDEGVNFDDFNDEYIDNTTNQLVPRLLNELGYIESTEASDEDSNGLICQICRDHHKNVSLNCGHAYCYDCLRRCTATRPFGVKCPYCADTITSVRRLYL
jgi:hypothetical protein